MSCTIFRVIVLTIFFVKLDCEVYQDRPKIRTSNGDLILEPALDKNIYLRPNGPKSTILIGNIDILKTNVPKDGIPYRTNTIENFDAYLNGPNGILERLERLENKQSMVPDATLLNITMIWRKLNNLKRRIFAIQNQLATRNQPKDECESHPCQHGGTCLNLVNGYHCLCPSNWEGQDCDEDFNECRNFAGTELGCQNGGTCVNKPGSYECLCKSGWYGLHCTTRAKDCSEGDFEMCGYGTCVPVTSGEGIKCICHQGWTNNATSMTCLTDINECDSYQGPRCSVNPKVDCVNLPGSFRCGQCPTGYTGDGYVCNDIDECTTILNGGCSPAVTCYNTIGSRICGSCPAGYQGDGVTCTFRGSCSANHGGCHPSAQCVESPSPTGQGSLCVCPEGMDGDGVGLTGCYILSNNFTGDCGSNPCGIHGRCHSIRSGYTCICYKGYSGAHCDSVSDVCALNPCHNGGICRRDDTTVTGFRCECSAQYTGATCQVRLRSCGGILDAEEGSIAYPLSNTTATYNNDAQCAWVIHTVRDKVINVTFTKFNLEPSHECSNDFLQIHDGRKSTSQLIGRFCGNTFPNGGNIMSNHNNLYFWFHSDKSVAKSGFALHWRSVKPICGGNIDATTYGHISSPGSPGPYPTDRDCYWVLTTTPGKRINLHFFALDIEVHLNCSYDYLAIYDGEHLTDPLLSKYCNSTQPAPVVSAGSEILIHFHSDSYGTGKGFQIAFAPVEGVPGCGGYFTADKGEIISPTFNGLYQSNLLCEYKIKTSLGTIVKIDIKQFELERSFRCRYDYLTIYDGPSPDSKLVGKFCGTTFPATYTASSNTLFMTFKTDRSHSAEGFRISYEALCEKTFIDDSGVLTSPSYPFSYPANKVCVYIIKTVPGKAIQLTFQDFDVEDNRYYNCRYDNVEIRDGPDINSTLLGRFCGGSEHTPPTQISTHNYLYVKFKSDRSLSGTGFYANYTTIDTECGGIHKELTGVISYPSGDIGRYKNEQSCQWQLIAPQGMHIKLTWNRFDLEHSGACTNDFLKLLEIDENNEETLVGTYCGNRTPPAMTTSSNRLKLLFESDISDRHGGFSISYTFLDERTHCNGNYFKSHGIIHSPGWPNAYETNSDCTWIITAPAGQQIALNISDFDLEPPIRNKCNLGDYLEVRNGGSETSPLIGEYCGKFQYKRITSLSNMLHLRFHSDFYLTGKGFSIEWDSTITGCGGTLTSSAGSITSPNYPNEYHSNAECFYKIVTSAGSRIRLSFVDLDLEHTPDCRDDYVEIYDGRDTSATSLGKHCVMSPGASSIDTTTNFAFIKFRSDLFVGAKGFMLNYNTLCNNNITGRYGVIESPDYPNYYPAGLNCMWTIQVPLGNRINLTFTQFDVFKYRRRFYLPRRQFRTDSSDCYDDYLQIKETSEPNFTKKYCGTSIPTTVSTRSNSYQIKFTTGIYPSNTGFRLEWVSYGCGGHIQKRFGTISIDKSLTNEKELECEWLIETLPSQSISITFTDIYMSDSKDCKTDAIEIYNGPNTQSPMLSKICHREAASIQTDSNFMLVRFVKKSTLRDVYFNSDFLSWTSKCGGLLSSVSGFINSKNYPHNYDNDLDCIWYITASQNHRIEINLMDFDLYSDSNEESDSDCGDSILIYDNNDIRLSGNYTYRICPNSNVRQIITTYSNIVVQFKTDDNGVAKGFKANFSIICGAVITAKHDGIITNSKYVRQSNRSCTWTIVAPTPDQKISLTITHMSLPKDMNVVTNRNCPSEFLRVRDGNDESAPLIAEYCGRKVPPMIVSQGNAVTVELGSYTDSIAGMFTAHYSPITNACGGTLNAEEGSIASPAYPSPYPVSVDCEWILTTSPGNTAYITFEQFDLEYSDGCNEDYLEVRENDGGGHLLGVYCGSDIPTNLTKSAKIYIKFHSDSKETGRGFVFHYGYLHENDIQGDGGVITSPLFPIRYIGAGEYVWRIITFGADIAALTVESLEIPAYDKISYNKLTIYDGYDKTVPVLDELYGALTEPKTILASSNVVYIVLTLDETNAGSKFYLSWTQSSGNAGNPDVPINSVNCGANETIWVLPGQELELKSPNYPHDYGNNLKCEWVYKTQVGRHVSIIFNDFEIEDLNGCFADSVSIYSADTPNNWIPIRQDICNSNLVLKTINASIYMKVAFKTDASVVKKGFLAEVRSVCGGLITGVSGEVGPNWLDTIRSMQSLTMSPYKTKCQWTIKVRPGRTIQLSFVQFNITNSDDKCQTYVVLRNGESIESPMLESGKYCGYEHENHTNIMTSSNSLFISYIEKRPRFPFTFQSFKIFYEEKNYECGSTSKLSTDHNWEIINSPNYPDMPMPYTECVWIFSGPPGEIIRIDFIDRFDLDYTDNCGTEAIEIRDGTSSLSPMLNGPYCGQKPGSIKSTNNALYVKYITRLSLPRNGFKANISIDICGGTIFADAGVVSSSGYPHMQALPIGTVCTWHIRGKPNYMFLIKPEDIEFPQSRSICATKLDFEEILPVNNSVTIVKTICNDDVETPLSTIETLSNEFYIKLTYGKPDKWDSISENRGFRISFNSSRPRCGGIITSSEGYLTTPGYPRETSMRYCQWFIEVPNKSRRVRLELIDSDPIQHITAYNDLSFHSSIAPVSNLSSEYRVVKSTGNKLAITVLLGSGTHRFKAIFSSDEQAVCSGDIYDLSQQLVSPDLQQSYGCDWHYTTRTSTANPNNYTYNSIIITAKANSSVSRNRCSYFDPQVIIKSPIGYSGITFRRVICNSEESYRIPSSSVGITALKGLNDSFYFNLMIKSQPCGGVTHVGEIPVNIFSNIPESYNDTLDCAWFLLSPINSLVEIKMEGSFLLGCDEEYVIIKQGVYQYGTELGRYCKTTVMDIPLVTHYSYMHIQYHSNIKNSTNVQFMAKTTSQSCGGRLMSYNSNSIFTSPNYPKSYSANQECEWEIRADVGFRISLKFLDRFVIEDKPNCTKDVLIIYDWKDGTYEEMARVCGRHLPHPYNSTNNQMKVVFRTDAEINLDGFKAHWVPICGGKYLASQKEQILFSPNYPSRYDPYMNCSYEISAPKNEKVQLKFLEFELEGTYPLCSYDNFTMIANSDYNYFYQVFCGYEKPPTTHNYEKITLNFLTDGFLQQKGFKISYSIFTCGGKINDTSIITSTIDDENYDANMNCTWLIEAPPQKFVVVKFLYIDLESNPSCFNDYVAAYDGIQIDENKRLAILCGFVNSTTVLRSTGNSMVLEFITDASVHQKGFKASIYFSYSEAAGCGGKINLTTNSVSLQSPLIDGHFVYENYLDCHWVVVSPPDTVINITFVQFHISPCQNINQTSIGYSKCDCDLVEINDGLTFNGLVIGTYCGHAFPPQLTSSGNAMSIRLSTDGNLVSSGFKAILRAQPSLCGQSVITVSSSPLRFKTPGYDTGSIPRGLHCTYQLDISQQEYNQIRITVINLQLRPSVAEGSDLNKCNKDKLTIRSTFSHSNVSFGKDLVINNQDDFFSHTAFYDSNVHYPSYFELCGHAAAVDYYVYGRTAIHIITSPDSDDNIHRGVEIEVAFVGFCGRNYTESQGRIQSSSGSYEDKSNVDCFTLITAPENYTISAYFINVIPDYWSENTFLKVYDGDKTSAKLIVNIHSEYDGNYPVFSTGRYMLLENHESNRNQITFDLNYVTTDKGSGCGGHLINAIGSVTSPYYPQTYRHKNICEWELETPVGTHLFIIFNVFELGVTCDQNYLELVDSAGVVVRTFCSQLPADYTSYNNYVKLVYHTSMSNTGRGWSATFIATLSST